MFNAFRVLGRGFRICHGCSRVLRSRAADCWVWLAGVLKIDVDDVNETF